MSIDFGTLVTHPLRIVILLVGFLAIKMLMLWLIAGRLACRAPSAAGLRCCWGRE
jgi:Kef-type K+ transport system membrane component KefB